MYIPELIFGLFASYIITLAVIIGLAFWFDKKEGDKNGNSD